MWYNNKFFRYSAGLLLILLIAYMAGEIGYIIKPLKQIAATILLPMLFSGLFYYILRPLVRFMVTARIPKIPAILIALLLLLSIIATAGISVGNIAASQVSELVRNLPQYIQLATDKITEYVQNEHFAFIKAEQLQKQFSQLMDNVVPFVTNSLFSGISTIANVTTVLFIVPFILFYLLKDDYLFEKKISAIVPERHRQRSLEILNDVDKTLSSYIVGQVIIAVSAGILMYIGYVIFQLNYSVILAIFVMMTSFIPIVGAFIGIIPAVLVGLTSSDPYILIKLAILMFVVQQLEGNVIFPQIIGKRMSIHPLTFFILLLAAASTYGFFGMLVAVPLYAVLKVLINNLYEIYKLRKG